jgi:hypothetical protein
VLVLVAGSVSTATVHSQQVKPTDEDVDRAIRACSLGTRTDARVEGGLNLLKQRILSGEGSFSQLEIPSVIGSEVRADSAKIDLFDRIQRCVVARAYGTLPTMEGGDKRVSGWLVTFATREAGGGAFGNFGSRSVVVPTAAAIDVRPYFPSNLSPRNVFVGVTATTDHRVVEPGQWVYFIKVNGAPQSYTQCMNFEVQSDGAPIGGGAVPILMGQASVFDTSVATNYSAGTHPITIKLACYFQGGQFPVVSVQLKPPSGEWRRPAAGDFTVLKTVNKNRPPDER